MLGAPSSFDCGIGRYLPNLTVDLKGIDFNRVLVCPNVLRMDQRTPTASTNQDDAETDPDPGLCG
jgi:hypothetical protein